MGELIPLRSKRRFASLVTYDLEWTRGKQTADSTYKLDLRLAGMYDGKRYRAYTRIDDFLNALLSTDNRGKRIYGHAAGLYDLQFLLPGIIRSGRFNLDMLTSGSAVVIARVTNKGSASRHGWTLCDSAKTFNQPLSDIGQAIGLPKIGEEEGIFTGPLPELMARNERDCVIPYVALDQFQNALFEIGGELRSTAASCAMTLFRRRFLKRAIHTSRKLNASAEAAYIASRVELFRPRCEEAYYYDINSSFPHAMTHACPGNIKALYEGKLPPEGSLYLADVEVNVPEMYLPPLPRRIGGRIFFPWGQWRSWFTSHDIELLQAVGGHVERVYEAVEFEPFYDLAEYANTLYQKRLSAPSEFESLVYKLLLNSLYGKFAEGNDKERLVYDPPRIACTHDPAHPTLPNGVPTCWHQYFPGAWLVSDYVDVPHVHVPISAFITSLARKNLYHYLDQCREVYYCDTDSVITSDELPTAQSLGALKLEGRIESGEFLAPKLYHVRGHFKGALEHRIRGKGYRSVEDTCAICTNRRGACRCSAGFRKTSLSYEDFQRLKRDDEIVVQRMLRTRELWRLNAQEPLEKVFTKGRKAKLIPKRPFHGPNDTRPYHLDELMRLTVERSKRKSQS